MPAALHPLLADLGLRLRDWSQRNPKAADGIVWWLQQLAEPDGETIPARMERAYRSILPPNWGALPVGATTHARHVMRATGLCLAWVPRAETVDLIIAGASKAERDAVLVANVDLILDDVEAVLTEATHPELGDLTVAASEAARAFRAGTERASQALCAAALGTVIREQFGHTDFSKARKQFETEHPERVDMREFRRASVQWTIRAAILRSNDVPPPEGFNRHLTTHGHDEHFTTSHAIAALMLLAGAVRELHELYTVGDRAATVVAA